MKSNLLLRGVLLALAISASPLPVLAQVGESTGNIVGQVDNLGSGAYSVVATNPATGRTRNATVSADGSFRFSQLPVGSYELTVSRDGKVVARDSFSVGLEGNTTARFALSDSMEAIVVTSSRVTGDAYSTDSGLILSADEVKVLPIQKNLTGVALLAPGAVLGDEKFGLSGGQGFVSFGGSSIAENSCFINGLEVTNTRQGLGCGEVPFEFYEQFQVKTGGYSAQFGRTTGGVLNAVTKSGTNEWEFGAGLAWEPDSLYEEGQRSFGSNAAGAGQVFRDSTRDKADLMEAFVSASGPIIEDHLFMYAVVNPRDVSREFSSETSGTDEFGPVNQFQFFDSDGSDNLFWGGKIDWDINDDHRLSAWGYSNRSDTQDVRYTYDAAAGVIGDTPTQTRERKRGGEAMSATYRGHFFENFTVSAMWGVIETEYQNDPNDVVNCPTVTDRRADQSGGTIVGCGPGGAFGSNNDENEQIRLDLEWVLGDHVLRAGYDDQTRDSINITAPVGGHNWTYRTLGPGASFQTTNGAFTNTSAVPLEFVRDRIFQNETGPFAGGTFSSELTAYYIEDEWQVTDGLVIYAGLRKDQLENIGAANTTFADFDQQWAPRVGFSWDPSGTGSNKFYGTFGRYYLPIANNTNFRVAAGVFDISTSYTYTGVAADGQPIGIAVMTCATGDCVNTNSLGTPPTQDQFQPKEADPFYKDEYILGYERIIGDEYTLEISGVYRETGTTLDDYCGPLANPGYCTLVNPGKGGSWSNEAGGELIFHSAEEIGLDDAENTYYSAALTLDRVTERMSYTFGYVWSKSYGNFEGAVKSDITQADPGITQDFDFPALGFGAYGDLPNDRRHAFKFYGTFEFAEDWSVGWNSSLTSGRPLSRFALGFPDLDPMVFGNYGDTFTLFTNTCTTAGVVGACNFDDTDAIPDNVQEDKIYDFLPRGKNGRTPWTFNLDASLGYAFETGNVNWKANMGVFNVLDIQEPLMTNEHAEIEEGTANPFYGSTYFWQAPRHFRFSIEARF